MSIFSNLAGNGAMVLGANDRVLTVGEDGSCRIFQSNDLSSSPTTIDFEKDQHSELAVSVIARQDEYILTGGNDNKVNLWKLTDNNRLIFERHVITLPSSIQCAQFAKHQSNLVVISCNSNDITVIDVKEPSMTSIINNIDVPKYMSFDPLGIYLATFDIKGVLRVFHLESTRIVFTKKMNTVAELDDLEVQGKLCYCDDGTKLCVPNDKSVIIYDRKYEEIHTITVNDTVSVTLYDPTSYFLVIYDKSKTVTIYNKHYEIVISKTVTTSIIDMIWLHTDLYTLDTDGQLTVYRTIVQIIDDDNDNNNDETTFEVSSKKNMNDNNDNHEVLTALTTDEVIDNKDKEEEDDDDDNKSNSDNSSDDEGSLSKKKRKRLRTKKMMDDKESKREARADRERPIIENNLYENNNYEMLSDDEHDRVEQLPAVTMQASFQPSATDMLKNRRYLCWNYVGSILTRKEGNHSSVEIVFNDTTKHRAVRLRDHYNFSMAALGDHGVALASEGKSDGTLLSTLFYKPFDSWSANSEWTVHLPISDKAISVAVGLRWIAVGTISQNIRIFSHGGVQRFIFSLPGPIVTMTGNHDTLAIVYHFGFPLPGFQSLNVMILDVNTRMKKYEGILPVSPMSRLSWLSFSDTGMLFSMDSDHIIRGFVSYWGGSWTPMLNAKKENSNNTLWPIAIINGQLTCTVCKGGRRFPSTLPRPVLSVVSLSIPLLNMETDEAQLEEAHLRNNILTYQTYQGQTPAIKQAGIDETCVNLFAKAVQSDRLFRALDISTFLGLKKSMDIAISVASKMKKPALAERINLISKAKFAGGRLQAPTEAPLVPSNEQFTYSSANNNNTNLEFNDTKNAFDLFKTKEQASSSNSGGKKTKQAGLFGKEKKVIVDEQPKVNKRLKKNSQ